MSNINPGPFTTRPEIEGTFTALPTSAGSMYDPGLLTRSGEARLRVGGTGR